MSDGRNRGVYQIAKALDMDSDDVTDAFLELIEEEELAYL